MGCLSKGLIRLLGLACAADSLGSCEQNRRGEVRALGKAAKKHNPLLRCVAPAFPQAIMATFTRSEGSQRMDGLERLEDGALRRLHGISSVVTHGMGGEEIMPPGADPSAWQAYLKDRERVRNERRQNLVGRQTEGQQSQSPLGPDHEEGQRDLTRQQNPNASFDPPPAPRPGPGQAGPNPGRGLTPENRGMVPDGKGGFRPGSPIGIVPSFDVQQEMSRQGQAPQAFAGQRFDPSEGEMPRPQPEGFARTAQGDKRGGMRVTDTRINPAASRFGTFQNADGTFTGMGATGNQGGFKSEADARAWSRANYDPANSQPEAPAPASTPAAPQPQQTTPSVAANPKGSSLTSTFFDPPPPAAPETAQSPEVASTSNPKGSSLSSSFFDPADQSSSSQQQRIGEGFRRIMNLGRRSSLHVGDRRAQVYGRAPEFEPPAASPPPVAQASPPSEVRTTPNFSDPAKDVERPRRRRDPSRVAQTIHGL